MLGKGGLSILTKGTNKVVMGLSLLLERMKPRGNFAGGRCRPTAPSDIEEVNDDLALIARGPAAVAIALKAKTKLKNRVTKSYWMARLLWTD